MKLRTQLTLFYAVPFLITGAALMSITMFSTMQSVPAGTPVPQDESGGGLSPMMVLSGVALVVVSFGLGWLVAGKFLRPLQAITTTAQDISASNLHRRLSLGKRNDEFKELAETLNDLFGRLEASFESQRHFVANASHELRTPLTAERTLLQVALADPDATNESLRAACQDVLTLGSQQERLIDALLTLASSEQGIEHGEPFDLAEITQGVVTARHPEAERRGIRVTTNLDGATAMGDPNLVTSLVGNLVDNALRHNKSGGLVEITTTTTDDRSSIVVRNTGPVIPPEELDRLFQPFQRLGGQRLRHNDGHGLGLAIVRAIANAHGATLTSHAEPEGGLRIEVSFPRP